MSILNDLKFEGSNATQLLRNQHKNTVKICENFLNKKISKEDFIEHIYFLLNVHFKIEEDILYPPFEPILKKNLPYMEPLKMVLAEHKGVNNLFNKYNTLNEEHDYLKDIAELLLQHVYKEENGIFHQIDLLMPENLKNEISEKINNFMEK